MKKAKSQGGVGYRQQCVLSVVKPKGALGVLLEAPGEGVLDAVYWAWLTGTSSELCFLSSACKCLHAVGRHSFSLYCGAQQPFTTLFALK